MIELSYNELTLWMYVGCIAGIGNLCFLISSIKELLNLRETKLY